LYLFYLKERFVLRVESDIKSLKALAREFEGRVQKRSPLAAIFPVDLGDNPENHFSAQLFVRDTGSFWRVTGVGKSCEGAVVDIQASGNWDDDLKAMSALAAERYFDRGLRLEPLGPSAFACDIRRG